MVSECKPTCAYCGGIRYHAPGTTRPIDYCKCKYRFMRMGESGFETETTAGRTASEMRKYIMEYLDGMKPEAIVAFKFSVTKLDDDKIAKATVKRHTKMVADRLLGKGDK